MTGFGVYTPEIPQGGVAVVDALQAKLQRQIGTVLWYQRWEPDTGWMYGWVKAVQASGRKPLLTWEPWGVPLAEIAAGKHDGYVRSFFSTLASVGGTVYLRFAHEMNGDWVPWGLDPAGYVAAWRHLHRLSPKNVRWVWCPNVDVGDPEPYWPGAAYVGVIGMDGYNFGDPWQSFVDVFQGTYTRLARLSTAKPIWVCETACAPGRMDAKANWIREMWARPALPRLREIVWFSVNKERDWRADDTPQSAAAFAKS